MTTNYLNLRGGINVREPAYSIPDDQCVKLQNLRYTIESVIDSIPGTRRYINQSIGANPVTGILPYYNPDDDTFKLLIASGTDIYTRDEGSMALTSIKTGLNPNKIYSSAMRFNVMYIPSESDGLMKFTGGTQIETVGGGSSLPGKFRQVIYMKEVDRLFGIGKQAIKGQIRFSNISQPEIWDGANVDRIKFQDGEIDEGAEELYGKLIIFNTYSIWIYYINGNPENWKLERAPTTVGCRAFRTIKRVGNEIWFLGDSPRTGVGIYAFNGSTARLLTDDIFPLMKRIDREKIGDCVAEFHNNLYTLSFPLDGATENNASIDLDTINIKEDGTPAIYGPHTFGFYSSAVLNTRKNKGEFLMGDQSDGFVYEERGLSFKSTNDSDGSLIQHQFLSKIHNDNQWDIVKRYHTASLFFLPRQNFELKFRLHFSYGYSPYADERFRFFPQASQGVSLAGDFNIIQFRIFGVQYNQIPQFYEHKDRLGFYAKGVAIQFELINDSINSRFAFQGYGYDKQDLYVTREAKSYAL